ncbi:MAG: carboxypeptidase regulatory-like domain-containing protein, partial [Bacteroidota bacterium]
MRTASFGWRTLAIVAAVLFSAPAYAQAVTSSTITGTVTDAAGQPLPSANVVATHLPSGTEYGTASRVDGSFTLPNVRVGGPYRVRATFLGFRTFEEEGFRLTLGDALELDIVLQDESAELGGVVVEAGGLFDPNRSGVDTNISSEEILSTPSIGRDVADFVRLTPQAYVDNDDDDGPAISIAGQNNRYNAIYIDGAVNNDVFGLSAQGTNGGQTGSTPISIDAIEQFQVALSPFSVTQSGFTGGAINAVTRSGTNQFEGSVYGFFRNEDFVGNTPGILLGPDDVAQPVNEFSANRYGFRLGGPIIQNQLFFFVNGEILRREDPLPAQPYAGNSAGRLDQIRQTVLDEFGYDAGTFGDKTSTLDDDKFLAKLDWNINPSNRLSARYSYSAADNTDNFQTRASAANFSNQAEFFPNRTNSLAVELNSTFGSSAANKLILGYTRVEDDRGVTGDPFPQVEIADGDGDIFLGSEPFSTANVLNQDVLTLTNNFNLFRGAHTLTFGANAEFFSIANLFIPRNFGSYEYSSTDDFLQSVCAAGSGSSTYCQQTFPGGRPDPVSPFIYQRGYSLVDGIAGDETSAIGAFDAAQFGIYAQDEWRASDRLNLSLGLRFDVPAVLSDPNAAPDALTATVPAIEQFYDLNGAEPGSAPAANLYISPRFGFNYDAGTDEQPIQLRGGTGIFVGRVPFVWPGGMFLNNGTNSGFAFRAGFLGNNSLPDGSPIPFVPGVQDQFTGSDFGQADIPSGRLEIFEDDFRYPTVWRSALGLDLGLPAGFTGTLEGQFTKTLENIQVVNVNLNPNSLVTVDGEAGERQVYFGDDIEIDDRYSAIHRVGSTSAGYTYDVTARVQNELRDFILEGDRLFVNLAY